jgi:hypothetical protein
MDELVDDMWPIIFQYLSQTELINIFFLNKKIYANVMKYIDNIPLFSELNIFNNKCKYNFEYICRMDCIISIKKYIKYRRQIKYNNKKIWTKCLYFAYHSDNTKYIKLMLNLGAYCSDILYLCKMSNNVSIMMLIVEHYYDIRKNDVYFRLLCCQIYTYANETDNEPLKRYIQKYIK